MSVVLVTGGAGFIGSHVVDSLLSKGCRVVVIDDLSGGRLENVNDRATFVEGSILDGALLKALFERYRFEHVYHFAAYAAEGMSHFIKRFVYTSNLIGSVNLINLAVMHDIKCFVFSSSIAVYGTGQLPLTEDMTPCPEDSYGISKFAVELELAASHKMFGLNHVIFRPHNVYGERQNIGDAYRNVIGIFMNQIMQNRPVTIFGDGLQTRSFSHIADVAPVMADAVNNQKAYNQVFNIGADRPYTILALLDCLSREMGTMPERLFLEARNEVMHAVGNHDKIRCFFDVPDSVPLEEGLRRMAQWAKSIGPCLPQRLEQLEITKKLPSGWA